VSFIEFI